MTSMRFINWVKFMVIFLILSSCATKQDIVHNATGLQQQSKLLFINYEINQDQNGLKTITFINKHITDGRLKNHSILTTSDVVGDLRCTLLNGNQKEISCFYIKNPLKKIVEYINDLGNFEKKIIDLDMAQFPIRLQLHSEVKYIKISELTQKGFTHHITTELE